MVRSRPRGLSLLELMVVAALFAGAMAFFSVIQLAVSKQGKRTTQDTELQDTLALTLETVKKDLRGARLVAWKADSLSYRLPVLDEQSRLVPGSSGLLQFIPPAPDFYQLKMDGADGWLKRHRSGGEDPRRMGRLGTGGLLVEVPTPDLPDLLSLTFRCQLAKLQAQATLQVYFSNQL